MKSTLRYLIPGMLVLAIVAFGCRKKDDEEDVDVENQYSLADYGANDESARNEYDGSVDEIFKALEGTSIRTGKSGGGVILPCGVIKIDSSGGKYKFVYGGQNCGTRVLSGSITAQLINGTAWSDVGAQISLKYDDYEVLFKTNNQVLTFNGELIITNRDGGWLYEVVLFPTTVITHTVHGVLKITFNQGDVRSWTVTKKKIFANSTQDSANWEGVTFSLAADGPTAETGTTKDGDSFFTTIPEPIVYENCGNNTGDIGPFVATKGKLVYDVNPNSLTIEAGYQYVNKNITKVGNCSATGYKLTYKINNRQSVKFQFY